MHRPSRCLIPILSVFALLLTGCVAPSLYDYTALENSRPRSILVIPPANNSIEVNGPYIFLATISRPLAEKGYYVFPVAVIDHFLKENGLPTPAEMNGIPLDKIEEHIGADAVLYVTIEDWGQKYQVLTSRTVVHSTLRLVDVKTGNLLWETTVKASRESGDSNQSLLVNIVTALATQVAGSISDKTPQLSSSANYLAVHNESNGLLHGPYFNPDGATEWDPVEARNSPAEEANLLFMGKAAGEIAAKSYDEKLWEKALALAEGDEQKRDGIYIKLRSNQLALEKKNAQAATEEAALLVEQAATERAATEEAALLVEQAATERAATEEAANEQLVFGADITGTYVSDITGNTRKLHLMSPNPVVKIVRNGNQITGSFGDYGGKIWGDIDGNTIKFEWFSKGDTGIGKWTVEPENNELVGTWLNQNVGEGNWNLKKIE